MEAIYPFKKCTGIEVPGTPVSDEALTDELVRRVLGWEVAPKRFIKSGRSWVPRWRFAPMTRLEDAFQLLDRAASAYKLSIENGNFIAEVYVGSRCCSASGEPKARTITVALASALGLESLP